MMLASTAPTLAQTPTPRSTVFYAKDATGVRFTSTLELSNRTLLIGGSSPDLSWLSPNVPRVPIAATGIANAQGTNRTAFILQLSADAKNVLRVAYLPQGAAEDVRWIKTQTRPGSKTGVLFVSGTTLDTRQNGGGYFLGRLDGNFVTAAPSKLLWTRNVWAVGDHQTVQPWDLGSDGKIVYITGQPFGYDWCAAYRINANGVDDLVPQWRTHYLASGQEVRGSASNFPTAVSSAVIFKATNRVELRSWTQADYDAVIPDGHGATKKGRWPMDAFFSGPGNPDNPGSSPGGPGYTGYRLGANPTQRVVAVVIDRRTNDIYIGFSIQSRLPDGNPDFEPAVIAYTKDGALKWWSRLYTETPQNSTPDQYVDALAFDYRYNQLIVLARCHGSNVNNLWDGGAGSFHRQFTGTQGNVHISWLGRLIPTTGAYFASTFVAEYTDGMSGTGAPYPEAIHDGWPSHNSGWPDLNTTRCLSDLRVDTLGRIYLCGVGRRTITTATAYQKMIKKSEGSSSWNSWVRVFAPDLKTLAYSTILTGTWDKTTGAGGDNTVLTGLCPIRGGVFAVGYHKTDGTTARGNAIPTANVPTWGTASPGAGLPIVARFIPGPVPTPTPAPPAPANSAGADS